MNDGETWIDVHSTFGDNAQGTHCQLSAITYSQSVVSAKDGNSYPAVLLTMAYQRSRTDCRIFVGLLKEDGTYEDGSTKYMIDWEYQYQLTEPDALFGYSSMAELSNGNVCVLYETSPTNAWGDGLKQMHYSEFDINTLIGQ